MYEMYGATGIEPWPHTWAEYRRIHTGWRRAQWEFHGHTCAVIANGLLPRKDKRSWQLADFTSLFKPAAKWKARLRSAADLLKAVFCGVPMQQPAPPPVPEPEQ